MPNIFDPGRGGAQGAMRGFGGSSSGGRSSGGGTSQSGARRVDRPLTPAEKKRNKSAETYKTKSTVISEKQARARAAQSERMKKAASKARTYNKAVATAAGAGGAVGIVAGSEVENRSDKYVPSDSTRRGMAMNRAKAQIKRSAGKSNNSKTSTSSKPSTAGSSGGSSSTGKSKGKAAPVAGIKRSATRVSPSKRQEGASRNRAAEGPKKSTAKRTRSR